MKPAIFVVGCSHSGTSLMLAVLGAHSKIYAIKYETRFMLYKRIDPANLLDFMTETVDAGKERWAEKTAEHIYQVDRILRTFPSVKVIGMLRDGRDVAASIYARTGDLIGAIEEWVETCGILEKWRGHPDFMVVRYEDIIADFEITMRQVFEFLDEEYEDDVRNFYKHNPEVEKPPDEKDEHHEQLRAWQLSQPLYDGRGRWKNELNSKDLKIVDEIAGDMLIGMGYT